MFLVCLNNLWRIQYKILPESFDLNNYKDSGNYISTSWDNKVTNLPSGSEKAFYLIVFSNFRNYSQQILFDMYGKIFYRVVSNKESNFSEWKKIF